MATDISLCHQVNCRDCFVLIHLSALACAQPAPFRCQRPGPQLPVAIEVVAISPTHAQLRGRVVGAHDSIALPAAVLTLEQHRSHRGLTSADSAGTFLLDSLAPGRYVLITQAIGFGVRRDTVDLRAAKASILFIPLTPVPRWECGVQAGSAAGTATPYHEAAT